MPWMTPRTWVTSEMVTAALLNTYLRDNLQFARDQVAARIHRSAAAGNQSISNAADNRVDMDTIDFDTTGTIVDLANDRLTFPVAGKYIVGANARFVANATGHRELRIYYHDSVANVDVRVDLDGSEAVTGMAPVMSTDTIFDCKAGDYVYLAVWQNSTAALNLIVLEPADPVLYIAREGI